MLTRMEDTVYRSGSGEPLVLLHGITSSWHGWKPVIPALAESYDVAALTLPGHLGWPWPEGPAPSMATIADLLEKRLGDLGIDTAHIVGNSLGGWASLELAARGRARSVTAFSPAGGLTIPIDPHPLFMPVQQRVAELRSSANDILADPERRQRMLQLYMEHGDRMPLEEAVRSWDAVLAVTKLAEMLDSFGDPVRSPVPESVPVSIVWGNPDRLLLEDFCAPGWHTSAPGAVWSHIDGGHTPMYDNPEAVVEAIRATIARA